MLLGPMAYSCVLAIHRRNCKEKASVTVPNSIATNRMTFTVDPSAGCVF